MLISFRATSWLPRNRAIQIFVSSRYLFSFIVQWHYVSRDAKLSCAAYIIRYFFRCARVVFPCAAHTPDEVGIVLLFFGLFLPGFFQQLFAQPLLIVCAEWKRMDKRQNPVHRNGCFHTFFLLIRYTVAKLARIIKKTSLLGFIHHLVLRFSCSIP